ncbi:MAG: mannose-1-phosphate guanylyltransferase [Pseudomonadota bacterium]|nr:mannose-1-phosphate guanylyltransferase [Pseudomonadota bacterium]
MAALFPIILSGGAGTRLWPVSQAAHPKPFLRLPDGDSLLKKAYRRVAKLAGVTDVTVVTHRDLLWKSKEEWTALGLTASLRFLLEPCSRNTAPALAIAALELARHYGGEAVALAVPADHLITDQPAFAEAVEQAVTLAQQGRIVTFGIAPTRAETGYGYIEADGERVIRFVEKPDAAQAVRYLRDGHYLWNSGMFCFRCDAFLAELSIHAPELLAKAEACMRASPSMEGGGITQIELDGRFTALPDISVDYALMEKSNALAVVRCAIGWSDVGCWNAVSDLHPRDDHGNVVSGEALLHDASGCYIQSESGIIAALGVSDLVIVNTPQGLLVADKSRAQEVREIAARLRDAQPSAEKQAAPEPV